MTMLSRRQWLKTAGATLGATLITGPMQMSALGQQAAAQPAAPAAFQPAQLRGERPDIVAQREPDGGERRKRDEKLSRWRHGDGPGDAMLCVG